jgi:UDP-2-acetamido-3-amino-2,3-dideoxy-glucuronate N-acetyltransferase
MKTLFIFFKSFFQKKLNYMVHPSAHVEPGALIGEGTKVWHNAHIRKGSRVGKSCVIGKSVYIDATVKVGNFVKIQNFATLYQGLTVEDGVYIGPSVTFTNDKVPRSINPDGTPKSLEDWTCLNTVIKKGASVGANATVLPGLTIGEWAMIGAGSMVTKDVPAYSVVVGNPAKVVGRVDAEGNVVKTTLSVAS